MQIIRSIQNTQDAINYTWEVTKGLTAAQLSNWTHLKGSPGLNHIMKEIKK